MRMTMLLSGMVLAGALQGCAFWPQAQQGPAALLAAADKGWLGLPDYERGKHYLAVGDDGLAVDAFQSALAREPGSIPAMNGLAVAYDRVGRPDAAKAILEEAAGRDPRSAETLNNLAYFHLAHGDRAQALAYLAQAQAVLAGAAQTPVAAVIANNLALADASPKAVSGQVSPAAAAPAALKSVSPDLWTLDAAKAGERMAPKPIAAPVRPIAAKEKDSVPSPRAAFAVPIHLRIANGTGRNDMALRFGHYLGGLGVPTGRLLNASGRDKSVIYYSRGLKPEAEAIARLLPVSVRTVGLANDYHTVELILASDLAGFDARLVRRGA